ncbi:MAG: glycerophosphodiester phosphodiesterase [Rhodospirillaceae bacterium]|nr:glycerophosphodiester phosphodiesterase [Rhodospirillaceae bacterium]
MAGLATLATEPAKPLIIAHRGASGYLPEHTLEAYARAIEMGADFIEPDLVSTKDGVLIVRHENELSDTTDVADKFPARKSKKTIDGRRVEGWFSEDFTLAEIKTLRAKQRLSFRSQGDNGKFQVPTFAEVLALVAGVGRKRGQAVGVYPETKHPTYFTKIGLPLEAPLIRELVDAGLTRNDAPVFIQSFEISNLKALKKMTPVPLIQLFGEANEKPYDQEARGKKLTYSEMATDRGLRDVAAYATGVGPFKAFIIPMTETREALPPTDFIARAHAAGLVVHPYTFRNEAQFLAKTYNADPIAEYCAFLALGVDGLFSDFPDTALKARDKSCPMRP